MLNKNRLLIIFFILYFRRKSLNLFTITSVAYIILYKNYINALYIFHNAKVLKILKITTNHHQKLSHSYNPVMFSTIKTPISFASEQLKTSTYGKRTNHF